jgi:hypothetical protein
MEAFMIIFTAGLLCLMGWREYLSHVERIAMAKINKVKDINELAFMFPDSVPHVTDEKPTNEKPLEAITLEDLRNGKE